MFKIAFGHCFCSIASSVHICELTLTMTCRPHVRVPTPPTRSPPTLLLQGARPPLQPPRALPTTHTAKYFENVAQRESLRRRVGPGPPSSKAASSVRTCDLDVQHPPKVASPVARIEVRPVKGLSSKAASPVRPCNLDVQCPSPRVASPVRKSRKT